MYVFKSGPQKILCSVISDVHGEGKFGAHQIYNNNYKGTKMTEELINSKEYFIAYSIMIKAAQQHGFATYQEIALAMGWPLVGNQMGKLVGDLIGTISENEITQGRPMLSVIVVGVDGKPGDGLYSWGKKLGVMSEDEDEETFWHKECEKVYSEWKPTYPYKKK